MTDWQNIDLWCCLSERKFFNRVFHTADSSVIRFLSQQRQTLWDPLCLSLREGIDPEKLKRKCRKKAAQITQVSLQNNSFDSLVHSLIGLLLRVVVCCPALLNYKMGCCCSCVVLVLLAAVGSVGRLQARLPWPLHRPGPAEVQPNDRSPPRPSHPSLH